MKNRKVTVKLVDDDERFERLHESGARQWGHRWLLANRSVILGAEIAQRGATERRAFRLLLTNIAYRVCVDRYGFKKSREAQRPTEDTPA